MATLGTNTGTQLTNDLATYLNQQKQNANGTLDTTQLAAIINNYLTTGEKLVMETGTTTNSVYKAFNTTDVVPAKNEIVTTGIFSNGSGSLSQFFTSSTSNVAGNGLKFYSGSVTSPYYYNVYASSASTAPVEFSVGYGHISGAGVPNTAADPNSTLATKATYFQYRALLTDTGENYFTFYSGSTLDGYSSNDIYFINLSRANYRERMDAGNWEIHLSGSKGIYTFIDNSGEKFNTVNSGTNEFNIVSGTLNLGTTNPATIASVTASNGQGFGKFYPDYGILVFNPTALSASVGGELGGSTQSSSYDYSQNDFLNAISGGAYFEARRIENVSTAHYFVRVNNREFNFSNNPTYTDATGSFIEPTFTTDPLTYITTVGLFNDANEMIAVAKTSQPIAKSFSKELLLKVKLDF
jgi:hypothetical protein